MDMSKAFNFVEWNELLLTLVQRQVNPIFLRLMFFIYTNQKCDVKWCQEFSQRFSVSNGVRQGAVSSAILFAVYIDKQISLMRDSWFGCRIHNVESVARSFTSRITGMENKDYSERLKALQLYSQERRRERYRIIFFWKVSQGLIKGYHINFYKSDRRGRLGVVSGYKPKSPALVRRA